MHVYDGYNIHPVDDHLFYLVGYLMGFPEFQIGINLYMKINRCIRAHIIYFNIVDAFGTFN